MKTRFTRMLTVVLCLFMALNCFGIAAPTVGAANAGVNPNATREKVVYATVGETAFVPAGYTYVYEAADGSVYTRTMQTDTYVAFDALTEEQAAAVAKLQTGEASFLTNGEGDTVQYQTFDTADSAEFAASLREIMGELPQEAETARLEIVTPTHRSADTVRAIVTFEGAAVIDRPSMRVELGGIGQAELAASEALRAEQTDSLHTIGARLGYELKAENRFTLLTNSVVVSVRYGDLAKIRAMSGVKSAYVVPSFNVPELEVTDANEITPQMRYAAPAMGADDGWNSGFTGKGMVVAIIDSGLYYSNPVYKDCVLPDPDSAALTREDITKILADNELHAETLSKKTAVSTDTVYYSSKIPFGFGYGYGDEDADFGNDNAGIGHGTHVAGIVAGNLPEQYQQAFRMSNLGIAPDAQLVIMNVSNRSGSIMFDSILAAMEDSILLGVDCANLSLGSPSGPCYLEGLTEVFDAAYRAGVNVTVSAGNTAFTGNGSLWGENVLKSSSAADSGTIGLPGTFDAPLTVASAENDSVFQGTINYLIVNTVAGEQFGADYYELTNAKSGSSFRDLLGGQRLAITEDPSQAGGKLLFMKVEGSNYDEQLPNAENAVRTAADAGAAGLVLLSGLRFEIEDAPLPVVTMYTYMYDIVIANIDPEDRNAYIQPFWEESENGGEMSDFSAWGPTGGLTLKPEITGIGGNVFSTYGADFGVASGTSMSSPAVNAAATLVRQYLRKTHPELSGEALAQVVNCLLMSTAAPIVDEAHDTLYFVRRQGAGMASIGAAIRSGAYIRVAGTNKAKLELGDDPERTGEYTMTFEVVNFSDEDVSYRLDATVLGQKSFGGLYKYGEVTYLTYDYARELDAAVTYSAENGIVAVPAGQTAQITVTVTMSDVERAYYDERMPYGGYVEGFIHLINADEDEPNLNVPFLAFYGDFSEAPALDRNEAVTQMHAQPYGLNDQVQTGMYSVVPYNREFATTSPSYRFWLGDTRAPGYSKVYSGYEDGMNKMSDFNPLTMGISPNDDRSQDELHFAVALARNAANIRYTVTNRKTGELLWEEDTGFCPKTYSASTYYAPALDWLFPAFTDPFTGEITYQYDSPLLSENTWVDIRIEVTPEADEERTEVLEYTLYLDMTPPLKESDYKLGYYKEESEWWTGWNLAFEKHYSEDWFVDYSEDYYVTYNSEKGIWEGVRAAIIYQRDALAEPGWLKARDEYVAQGLGFGDDNERRIYSVDYDYAGNAAVVQISTNDDFSETFGVTSDKLSLEVGEVTKLSSVAKAGFVPLLYWEVSDPELAQLLVPNYYDPDTLEDYYGRDAQSVYLKALKPGKVTVSGWLTDHAETLEIYILNDDYRAALAVIDLINALPEPEAIAEHHASAVSAARAAYDALTDAQKEWVENYGKLTDCEAALQKLLDEHRAAQAVTDLIDALPEPEAIAEHHASAVSAARAAYDALTDAQKEWVENYGKLTDCEAALQKLLDEQRRLPFTDVGENDWFYENVLYVYHNGLMQGQSETSFAPNTSATRAMLVTTLYRMAGSPEVTESSGFADVPDGRWYSDAIAWARAVGIAKGVSDTAFAPNAPVTREEAVTFLYRYVTVYLGRQVQAVDPSAFSDADRISGFAREAVAWAAEEGILHGYPDGSVRPASGLIRAELAALLERLDKTI